MRACIAAEESEIMLYGDNVHMTEINVVGGTDVVVFDVTADFKLDGVGILAWAAGLERNDEGIKVLPHSSSDILDQI